LYGGVSLNLDVKKRGKVGRREGKWEEEREGWKEKEV